MRGMWRAVLFALPTLAHAMVLQAPAPPQRAHGITHARSLLRARRVACAPRCFEDDAEALTPDGGLRKSITRHAEDGSKPPWGALVSIHFTGRFPNGTVFDGKSSQTPFEFQLNAGAVVDGMERGVKSMRPGEAARLTCSPRWAYGGAGVGSRIPPNATLMYDVELLSWKEGPPIENHEFDMHTYRSSLEGKKSGSGRADTYRWSEGGEEVSLWLPLRDGESARDVVCEFRPKALTVRVGAGAALREVRGELKGRCVPDECYWVLDEAAGDGTVELHVTLAKAGIFVRWDGVLIGEDELEEPADFVELEEPDALESERPFFSA